MKRRIFPFFLPNLGCDEHCCFCRQDAIAGLEAAPTPSQVARSLSEVENCQDDFEVAFYGGSFTSLPVSLQNEYLRVAGDFVRKAKGKGEIRVSARPDRLDTEILERIKQSGVKCVEVGCQSFSDHVLFHSGRGYNASVSVESIERLHEAGLRVGIQLMPGLPGGDRAEASSSLDMALRLQPEFVRLYPTVVLKGTPLAKRFDEGLYRPLELPEAVDICAELSLRCEAVAVPVARVGIPLEGGLQATDVVLAGPVHPAFGQLVKSEMWRKILTPHLVAGNVKSLIASTEDYSDLVGHKREMLNIFRTLSHALELRTDSGLVKGELLLDRLLLSRQKEIEKRYLNHERN